MIGVYEIKLNETGYIPYQYNSVLNRKWPVQPNKSIDYYGQKLYGTI